MDLMTKEFYWPKMTRFIRKYVATCPFCQRNKPSNRKPMGLLQPIPIPTKPWEEVTIDLIIDLPKMKDGCIAIVVFVDRLTKMAHFVPLKAPMDAPAMAKAFLDNVFRLHGLPCIIISDRDIRFTSRFWQTLLTLLGTTLSFSTAYHPQSDGQTERVNRVIEEML